MCSSSGSMLERQSASTPTFVPLSHSAIVPSTPPSAATPRRNLARRWSPQILPTIESAGRTVLPCNARCAQDQNSTPRAGRVWRDRLVGGPERVPVPPAGRAGTRVTGSRRRSVKGCVSMATPWATLGSSPGLLRRPSRPPGGRVPALSGMCARRRISAAREGRPDPGQGRGLRKVPHPGLLDRPNGEALCRDLRPCRSAGGEAPARQLPEFPPGGGERQVQMRRGSALPLVKRSSRPLPRGPARGRVLTAAGERL
jgi:hypothetical protein